MKYVTIQSAGVTIGIGKTTDIRGYTETVLEPILLSEQEMSEMRDKEVDDWIKENNKRMAAICKFMNKSGL